MPALSFLLPRSIRSVLNCAPVPQEKLSLTDKQLQAALSREREPSAASSPQGAEAALQERLQRNKLHALTLLDHCLYRMLQAPAPPRN